MRGLLLKSEAIRLKRGINIEGTIVWERGISLERNIIWERGICLDRTKVGTGIKSNSRSEATVKMGPKV